MDFNLKEGRKLVDNVLKTARLSMDHIRGVAAYKNSPDGLVFSVRTLKETTKALVDASQELDLMADDLLDKQGGVEDTDYGRA